MYTYSGFLRAVMPLYIPVDIQQTNNPSMYRIAQFLKGGSIDGFDAKLAMRQNFSLVYS